MAREQLRLEESARGARAAAGRGAAADAAAALGGPLPAQPRRRRAAAKAGAWTDGDDASLRSKLALLGGYAFCLVLENSIAADYVTEKLFHAFAAGCVPVYYGTRDVSKVLPHARAAVQVLDHPDVPSLARELATIAATPGELQARLAWRDDAAAVDVVVAAAQRHRRGDDGDEAAALLLRLRGGARGARARSRRRLPPSRRPPSSAWAAL